MKKLLIVALLISSVIPGISAKGNKNRSIIIDLNGSRFTESVVEAWIEGYNTSHPDSQIEIEIRTNPSAADITLISNNVQDGDIFYAGRYVLLPVCNGNNPLLGKVKKGLGKNELKKLLFLENEWADEDGNFGDVNIYTRRGSTGTSVALADFYGSDPDRLKGTKIAGDDKFLVSAVKLDEKGITFNTLNYIFDIESRELFADIRVLPLNLKQQHRAMIESDNIDRTLELFESQNLDIVPIEHFGFRIENGGVQVSAINDFITWILTEGQELNHSHGFLNLENEIAQIQLRNLNNRNVLAAVN